MENLLNDRDLRLFAQGKMYEIYRILGAHPVTVQGVKGVRFAVWAPNAKSVAVVGEFNKWNGQVDLMLKDPQTNIWTRFVDNANIGDLYKYQILTIDEEILYKADPVAFYSQKRPETSSVIADLNGYQWSDDVWQKARTQRPVYESPINIYEVHLGSWKRKDNGEFYTYRELAEEMVDYVVEMGYTHIELLPIMEHPFDGSWGYQITNFYAVTSRFGTPKDFMYFVDCCHQRGIGVILDWVPGHFCKDDHGLRLFDGRPLYEYSDPRQAEKSEWGTLSFDFGSEHVQAFLISNAIFWMEMYHIDGLRVDAVASMLYLDFGKAEGHWIANRKGGRENLEAIAFLQSLNEQVFARFPDTLMMAEESTDWPLVSAPAYLGGLGFNYKWNMGWMNDMLKYMRVEPEWRSQHHQQITFSLLYAFSENFILPLSHDEVVHGKRSLIDKMPGDYWKKFANLRLLLGYMITHPGKKLLFMGGEFGQFIEWNEQQPLDWFLLNYEMHKKLHEYVRSLNHLYKENMIFWDDDHRQDGFSWIDADNSKQSVIVFLRKARDESYLVIVCNFTPKVYRDFKIGVPELGEYKEIFNSDAMVYGGSGHLNCDNLHAIKSPWHQQPYCLEINIPPLAVSILKPVEKEGSMSVCQKNNV